MSKPLRVLFVEDSADDADLAIRELRNGGFDVTFERIETPAGMTDRLNSPPWDLIISDYVMPRFSGLAALKMVQEHNVDIPFIIISGKIGEDIAVEAMKAGAHDYFVKGKLTRLAPAVDRELREAEVRRERQRSDERLRRNAFELSAIFQALPDLYFRLSSEGVILDCKGGFLSGTLLPPDRLIGRSLEDIFQTPISVEYRKAITGICSGQPLVVFEYSDSMNDGEHFFEARYVPLLENQVMAIVRDITTRRRAELALEKSEKRFRSVVETASDAIVTTDATGKIQFWNSAAETIFGYSEKDILGKSLELIIADSSHANLDEIMTSVFHNFGSSQATRVLEISGRRSNGTEFPAELSLSSWKSDLTAFATAILRDISRRKSLERDILRAGKLESLGTLAGGIAHDFNNLLTTVFGSISLARQNLQNSEKLEKLLDSAETACKHAAGLTRKLLIFSKGGMPHRVSSSIEETIRGAGTALPTGTLARTEFHIPKDLWPANVDADQIGQVIQNLVLNADQAMPHGGNIIIRAENVIIDKDNQLSVPPGRYIKLSISDQGIGIPLENQTRIFDPYFTTKSKGTGLGLSIVYSIIKKHDGFITLSSQPGEGTIFYLYLPASFPHSENTSIEAGETQNRNRILVMDDEISIRELLGMALRDSGFDVVLARDGTEAIKLFKSGLDAGTPFSLALLDLSIPGAMGGQETLEHLRKINPEIKAIVSSGYSDDQTTADFHKLGFNAVLSKPYDLEQMISLLNRVISDNLSEKCVE
ncbi:MAG: response regulator [Candidatus Riflebacteria bacterium]|nr:response regulator [Candidatus Riflebacteria bacterium]